MVYRSILNYMVNDKEEYMKYWMQCLTLRSVIFMFWISDVFAQTPEDVVNGFSTRMIEILKGPIVKILGALILLAGVASLLRGRHKLAISCGAAFIILLFLPFLLEQLAGIH